MTTATLGTLLLLALPALGQNTTANDLTWTTDAAQPQRFVAAHGQQAVVMGYPATGLEVWAYPLQLISGYQVSFLEAGAVQPIGGLSLLRRVEYTPEGITRIYVGPDFVVREHLFVPINRPGAILTYEVEGTPEVKIQVHFQPSLNLMWPGALGGQSIQWNPAISGYVEQEPLYGYSATIASPDVVNHDDTTNRAIPLEQGISLVLAPKSNGGSKATSLYFALNTPHTENFGVAVQSLESDQTQLQTASTTHFRQLLDDALQVVTPDPEVNRSLSWAEIALDQAWVCNPMLGCGEVAGYGASRPARRPQYDWFFAGDGLIAMDAMLSAGEYDRARAELEFVTKNQNPANGMIWHELSQSAALIDWQHKYPYMFVHVDITFQYLAAVAQYVTVTGDKDFLSRNWTGLEAAWHYCQSVISPDTKLPQIPPGKEGENEQDRMRDDTSLSSLWISAADGFAQIATLAGHSAEAQQAMASAAAARKAIATEDWDPQDHFWLAGHTITGKPVYDQRPNPSELLLQHVFSAAETDQLLDRIASPAFQTDWGTRGMSSDSAAYLPNSYGAGSVSALGSSSIATTFWSGGRPLTAWEIWHALVPWNTLDSEGHVHELLAGDLYHPEIESVPEQTWSSAGFLSSAVHGLLGLDADALRQTLTFAPHLPATWNQLTLRNVHVGSSTLELALHRTSEGLDLQLTNNGKPVTVAFHPELPLGAVLTGTTVNSRHAAATLDAENQQTSARVQFAVPQGRTLCHLGYQGGVAIDVPTEPPMIGDRSHNLKILSAALDHNTLTISGWRMPGGPAAIDLFTPWKAARADGASLEPRMGGYSMHITPSATTADSKKYKPFTVSVELAAAARRSTPSKAGH